MDICTQEQLTTYNLSNLMTISEYAKMRGVTRQTVYNWINEGLVKTVPVMGRNLIDKSTAKK